jgi:hypothetical protein
MNDPGLLEFIDINIYFTGTNMINDFRSILLREGLKSLKKKGNIKSYDYAANINYGRPKWDDIF